MRQKITLNRSRKISSARRGQMLILFALLIPVIMLFVGLGLDIGWYYLNVSRLQNAADAAALAGARKIIDTNSTKLKDLVPVLVAKLPADNGLDDDGEPRVETSTSTETTTETTETDEGTTTTFTETTTTTTTTISKTKLEDLDWTDGDTTARNYAVKNIGTTQAIDADADETASLIIDSWSLFSSDSDRQVDENLNLVKVNGDFYYIVTLDENIRHFFLSGWFNSMEAKVVAIAKLVPKDQVIVDTSTEVRTWTEFIAKLKDIINRNVIVGNWEVQDKYKNTSKEKGGGTLKTADLDITDPTTGEKVTFLNSDGSERTEVTKYEASFGTTVYSDAWNHFQDFYNHYYLGDLYRKENVIVKDDVIFNENPNGTDIIDRDKNKGTITSYGVESSVAATSAAINDDPDDTAYNPGKNTRKTYKDGITESGTVGLPYTWKRLDSINIDFRVENTLSGKWLSEDWDLELGFDGVTNNQNTKWENSGSSGTNKIDGSKIRRLRIHTSVDFEDPYKVRPDVDTDDEPDILWGRIESEPILYHPDITERARGAGLTSKINQTSLNSVNQIILNFNQSNYDTSSQRYRPLIIFYDGPETNSIYSNYDTANKFVRQSKPVIVNLNAPYRTILYMPNSPVVIVGDKQDDFKGFIVAKSYVQLKDDSDFILAEDYLEETSGLEGDKLTEAIYTYAYRYFNQPNRQYEYTRNVKANGTIKYVDLGGTKESTSVTKDEQAYRLKVYYAKDDPETDPAKKKRYYKMHGKNSTCPNEFTVTVNNKQYTCFKDDNGMKYIKPVEENGIDMFVDEYGDIQYKDFNVKPTKIGTYDNFGRTDFTTHNYHVETFLEHNLLLSGK